MAKVGVAHTEQESLSQIVGSVSVIISATGSRHTQVEATAS